MLLRHRCNGLPFGVFLGAVAATACLMTVAAQAPLPVAGQRGQGPAPGRQGQAPANLPQAPMVSPIAAASDTSTAPGQMFPALMSLPAGDDMMHLEYEAKEYSSAAWPTASRTRRALSYAGRRTAAGSAASSSPSRCIRAAMRGCFISRILYDDVRSHRPGNRHERPGAVRRLQRGSATATCRIAQGQANEIIAQVGALIRSSQPANPLAGLAAAEG